MTFDKVCSVLAHMLECEENQLTSETKLSELNLDSFEAVELIASLEEEFGVNIKTAYIKKLKTVGDLAHLIDTLKADM